MWVGIGVLIGIVVWKTGIGLLRSLTRPLPTASTRLGSCAR